MNLSHRFVFASVPLVLAQLACTGPDMSGNESTLSTGISTATDVGTTDDTLGSSEAGKLDLPPASDLPLPPPEECVSESLEGTLEPKPVDVVIFVDTSSSMAAVSNAVELAISDLIDAILAIEMTDVRVILVAAYGGGAAMCIPAPIGADNCAPPGPFAPEGPTLYQYSVGLGSGTFIDLIIDTYTGTQAANPAVYEVAPNGWQTWARPEAFKVLIGVTDAASMSTNAALGDAFDAELLALAPEQFGTADARNYVLHSITGIYFNEPPEAPYPPTDPLVVSECEGEPGQPLQQIAILTGGLRFGICGSDYFPELFDDIGVEAAEATPVACDFAIPDAPPGETLDPDTFEVEYFPGGADPGQLFHQVPSEADCEPAAFWVDASSIHLCPSECTIVQADAMARVEVRYGCDVGYDPNG